MRMRKNHQNDITRKYVQIQSSVLTSHGGGALLYDGTILNVTEPRASRWNFPKVYVC